MIFTEQEYLFNNYFWLVSGEPILRYQRIKRNPSPSAKEAFLLRVITRDSAYSKEEIEELIKMLPSDLERELIKQLKQKHAKRIYYNRCPKCNQLARTSLARQCPNCAYTWFHCKRGSLKVNKIKNIKGNAFEVIIIGTCVEGVIENEMNIDLVNQRLGTYPKIIYVIEKGNKYELVVQFDSEEDKELFITNVRKSSLIQLENKNES